MTEAKAIIVAAIMQREKPFFDLKETDAAGYFGLKPPADDAPINVQIDFAFKMVGVSVNALADAIIDADTTAQEDAANG